MSTAWTRAVAAPAELMDAYAETFKKPRVRI
jgi:hypothetical protein